MPILGAPPSRLARHRPGDRDLFGLALVKGWGEETQVRGLADGARDIRTRMEEEFRAGNFKFILDRPHCREHLTEACEALEKLTGTPAQEWARVALNKLETGEVAEVVAELKRAWELSGVDEDSRDDT